MKVAIITTVSLQFTPYVDFYVSLLKSLNIDYIIINKENSSDEAIRTEQRAFTVRKKGTLGGNVVLKTVAWYKFVLKTMKQEKCDLAVVLPTRAAVVLFPLLVFKKYRYIFDIRDYTNEKNKLFGLIVKLIIKQSELTVISSNGFREWLPESPKITNVHNMPYSYSENNSCVNIKGKKTLTVGYVGCVDYERENKKIMDALGNDRNFVLQYSGTIAERCKLQQYSIANNFDNVRFTGRFNNTEKQAIYNEVDIINAVYGNDSLVVTTALPNKLYDAIIYKKPIIASSGTYLGQLIEENGIGIAIDVDNDNINEKLKTYVDSFDAELFLDNCKRLLQKCIKEQNETIRRIRKVLSNKTEI